MRIFYYSKLFVFYQTQPSNGGHYHSDFLPNPVKSLCKILYVTGLYNPLLCYLSPSPCCLCGTAQTKALSKLNSSACTELTSLARWRLPPRHIAWEWPYCLLNKAAQGAEWAKLHRTEQRTPGSPALCSPRQEAGELSRLGLSRDGRFWNCRSEGGHVW